MTNLAINLTPAGVFHEFGIVEDCAGEIGVRSAACRYAARRSASCLLQPEVGDRVLLAVDAQGLAYVLAVLERAGDSPSCLLFGGDVELLAPTGSVRVSARDCIALASTSTIEATAARFALGAGVAEVTVGTTRVSGSRLEVCVDAVRRVSRSVDEVIDRWTQLASRVLRRVDEVEQLKAGRIEMSAKATLSMSGENTLVTARKLVKVDADQIHLG